METNYLDRAKMWLSDSFDEQTRAEVRDMIDNNPQLLEDSFYRNLEFGTGGLRGIMGAGTNRMNKYTVGMATQGLANYLNECFSGKGISVVVSYDSRNNSKFFAQITAGVLLENGIKVYLFDDIRPTPELSFAIRYLECNAGVMITASHNPKEYNGYKVFWEDGAQIIAPHDKNIIEEVGKIDSPQKVLFPTGNLTPVIVGEQIDNAFLSSITSLTLTHDAVERHSDIKIVYTPLHGTGIKTIPPALGRLGFKNIYHVEEQDVSDGDFPTVVSPNPEEPTAMKMAMEKADSIGADIVLASDPDADRVGLAVRNNEGELQLLTGNQIASILVSYMLTRWHEKGKLTGKEYIVKTIVTTEMLSAIAYKYNVPVYNVLTGFKYIAEVVRHNEGKMTFICGGEESDGFNAGEYVRDKDAAVTCCLIAECAAWLADSDKTLYSYLEELYKEFGLYREKLVSVVRKGKDGVEQIQAIMSQLRENPPKELAGSGVFRTVDYLYPEKTGLPKSNVLQFFSNDHSVVSVRPSGTEPKIKFYFGANGPDADAKIDDLVAQFVKQ
ncbi:MAG: phospho-sugar mutase [Bacteroidales bacterium]|nr:phospho-sugar mutase [Bacteroidales bacterium]